jgi:hypothetical protein
LRRGGRYSLEHTEEFVLPKRQHLNLFGHQRHLLCGRVLSVPPLLPLLHQCLRIDSTFTSDMNDMRLQGFLRGVCENICHGERLA